MNPSFSVPISNHTLAIIMGGGAGTRLFPLTKERAKPAVPLGGKYRLVDIPISNCIGSGIRSIYVLTQFNSTSLHRHINASYKFDSFSKNFVEILAAQQTPEGSHWYQGTADAVRQNLRYFLESQHKYFLILSGDQLYRMDYRKILQQHVTSEADLTIATIPVCREAAHSFGIMHTDEEKRISQFKEKPATMEELAPLRMPKELLPGLNLHPDEELYQASMGIYIFNRQVLIDCLDNNLIDFGKNIIPVAIERYKVLAYIFQGYWEDVGTIRAFFNANLLLTDPSPAYSFYQSDSPVYTQSRFLPASVLRDAKISRALIADGCIIDGSSIDHAVLGIRSMVHAGTTIKSSIIMGADFYEDEAPHPEGNVPPLGIGNHCHIDHAIIDKNARIGNHVIISEKNPTAHEDGEGYYIRDGIVIIPKNGIIYDGTQI